jgi:pimeloyl-ACP methyl ester carboxylesterase
MNPRRFGAALVLAAALGVAGCAPYASVSSVRPGFHPAGSKAGALALVERRISTALRQQKRAPLEAIGGFLAAAQSAQQQLARDPANIAVRYHYNFAVARVIGAIQRARPGAWTQPLRVPAADGGFVLTCKRDPDPERNPALYDLIPADELRVKGAYVRDYQRKEGIGAPLVAIERGVNHHFQRDHTMPRIYYGVTAVIRFEGRRAVIAFEDPLVTERVILAEHQFPLAADFTAPIAVLLAQQNPRKLELESFLQPEKYAETAHVTLTQPYDPNKTVVLIIHGLKDSPATWVPMFNHLIADEQIRHNYQLWSYSYPTGYPYPYSAAILRRDLDAIESRLPLRKKMVVIGHSMGGCISRLLITDTGDKLWREIFQRPPSETEMPPESKALLTQTLIFRHRPEIGRVIFIAAPLRGSDLARNWIGRTSSTLVKVPRKLLRVGSDALRLVAYQRPQMRLKRAPNSVDSLAPNDLVMLALEKIPLTPGIPHHVICGDRGKRGHKDKTKPVMSDGVVPYWSSHMDTAESELIVPSGHDAHKNPQAIAEVGRILRLHAGR